MRSNKTRYLSTTEYFLYFLLLSTLTNAQCDISHNTGDIPLDCKEYDLIEGDVKKADTIFISTGTEQPSMADGRCISALLIASSSQKDAIVVTEQSQSDRTSFNRFKWGVCEPFKSCTHREQNGFRVIALLNPRLKLADILNNANNNIPTPMQAKGPRVYVNNNAIYFFAKKSKSNIAKLEKRKKSSHCLSHQR